jgi:hypothetical protein
VASTQPPGPVPARLFLCLCHRAPDPPPYTMCAIVTPGLASNRADGDPATIGPGGRGCLTPLGVMALTAVLCT